MRIATTCIALALCTLTGCGELSMKQKERQMELVARDWSMTIRASQVVPVYPLTQDLHPGDVFLVKQTVKEQSARFRDRGFLPTDLRVGRLAPVNYRETYAQRTAGTPGTNDPLLLPGAWRDEPGPTTPWERFPRAGFPSYTFEVSNSGGLSVAVPVSSIPVALSVTGAANATGSITMSDAFTYGTDAPTLYRQLRDAIDDGTISGVTPTEGVWFLRVVTQVYGAKTFDITLNADSNLGIGASAGGGAGGSGGSSSGKTGEQLVDEINSRLDTIRNEINAAGTLIPGASARATFASARTIGFKETFAEPLIVGYQGFDVAIDSDGNIGRIIPTFQLLDDRGFKPDLRTDITDDDRVYSAMIDSLRATASDPDLQGNALNALRIASSRNPDLAKLYNERLADPDFDGRPVDAWVDALRSWEGAASRRTLANWLADGIREAFEE